MTIGERVKEIREKKGWTQEKLADKSFMSKSYLSEVENNKTKPGAQTLLQIATALGATVDYLLQGGTGPDDSGKAEIIIPATLSEAAEELNLTHAETLELLVAYNSVFARRSNKTNRELGVQDWIKLHKAIKEAFG